MIDFGRYFLHEQQIFLDNVNYEMQTLEKASGEVKLNVKDTIVAQLMDKKGVKVTFNRTLSFDTEGMFFLSVTFGVFMRFNPVYYDEIMWKNIDIAGEFKLGCQPILTNLMSRTSMMISQITSAAGQVPIITPGGMQQAKGQAAK